MTAGTSIANVTHARRARGWPRKGKAPEDATTQHTTETGTTYVAGTDSADRNIREAKWNARDNYGRT